MRKHRRSQERRPEGRLCHPGYGHSPDVRHRPSFMSGSGFAGLVSPSLPVKGMRNAGRVTAPVGPACTRERCTQAKERARMQIHACVPHTTNFSACNSQQRLGWRFDQVRASPHCWALGPPTLACRYVPSGGCVNPSCGGAISPPKADMRDGSVAPAPRRDVHGVL